jgi:hypothetical protein
MMPSSDVPAPTLPQNAVWKELSTNDESLSKKATGFGGSYKHVKSSKAFAEESLAKKPEGKRKEKTQDQHSLEIDQLIRDVSGW